MFAFVRNKIYGGYMETKARRQTARERPLCKRKVAGAIPAESKIFLVKNYGGKPASGSGCGYDYYLLEKAIYKVF